MKATSDSPSNKKFNNDKNVKIEKEIPEISKILLSLSQLTTTIDTLVNDRLTDRKLLDENIKYISEIKSLYISSAPPSPLPNPLDNLSDDLPTSRRVPRRSSFDIAMKVYPLDSVVSKKVNFLFTPITSNLELKYLSVSSFLSFWKDFVILQQKHPEQVLQLGNHMSSKVIEELVAEQSTYDGLNLETHVRGGQLNLDNSDIYSMLIKKITPRTKEIFILTLNRHLEFPSLPSGYIVSVNMYRPMYLALLAWQSSFFFLYDILTTDLQCDLPQFRTRNGVKGILDSFLDPIPQDNGHKLLKALNFDQVKNMKDLKQDFIPVFMAFAKQIYHQHNVSLDLNLTTGMYVPPTYSKRRSDQHPTPQKLSYLPDCDLTTTKNSDLDYYEDLPLESIYDTHTSTLQAIDNPSKQTLPCFVMMRTGKCPKGNSCTYSHITKDLVMSWQAMFNDLKTSPFNARLHPQITIESPISKLPGQSPKRLHNLIYDSIDTPCPHKDENDEDIPSLPNFLD